MTIMVYLCPEFILFWVGTLNTLKLNIDEVI